LARQSLYRAAVHGKECSATIRPAKPSLPCVARKSHGKGFAERPSFVVRYDFFAVRFKSLPCGTLCRALPLQPARQRVGFAMRFPSTLHGKES
jgi:hypothetical protein